MAAVDASRGYAVRFYREDTGAIGSGTGWGADPYLGIVRSDLDTYDDRAIRNRVNLLAVPYMDANRQPFANGGRYLAVFWNVDRDDASEDDWFGRRAYTTGRFAPYANAPEPPKGWRSHRMIARPFPGHSVAVAVDGGNVMQLFSATSDWRIEADPDAENKVSIPDSLWFAPYAGGMPPVVTGDHSDNNDNAVIEENLCESVWRFEYGDLAICYCVYSDPNWWNCFGELASTREEICRL